MKLGKKIGIGLGVFGIASMAVAGGIKLYKEYKKKDEEEVEDIILEAPIERLESLEEMYKSSKELEVEEESKTDVVPLILFSAGAIACFGAAYLLCCRKDEDENSKADIEDFEVDNEDEKVGDAGKGEVEEENDFQSALSKTTGKLEEIHLEDNTAELLYGKKLYK